MIKGHILNYSFIHDSEILVTDSEYIVTGQPDIIYESTPIGTVSILHPKQEQKEFYEERDHIFKVLRDQELREKDKLLGRITECYD